MNTNTNPNPNNQLVPYIPGHAGRMQGDHSNGTWNTQQQQESNNDTADSLGASILKEQPVKAVLSRTSNTHNQSFSC
jgi:hypothetical protein